MTPHEQALEKACTAFRLMYALYETELPSVSSAIAAYLRARKDIDGAKLMLWPPDGDTLQACADELAPYTDTEKEYTSAVEQAADVLDAFNHTSTADTPDA